MIETTLRLHGRKVVIDGRVTVSFRASPFSSRDTFAEHTTDEMSRPPRKLMIPVAATLEMLLAREDTDKNYQITIDDDGPKVGHCPIDPCFCFRGADMTQVISLGTAASSGINGIEIRGTYMLSNLLQELTIANGFGRQQVILDESRLNENPVARLSRLIKDSFWDALTRRIDASVIEKVGKDPKDWTDDPRPRVYVPRGAPEQYEYYKKVATDRPEIRLDVQWLSQDGITPEYVRDLNQKPGLLALEMEEFTDPKTGQKSLKGLPFIVPGGRFNELYGWDSYMESLGLIISDRVNLAKSMVQNFCFCIKHYGKILNANRTYYLCRSQPPFLTDMALRVYEKIKSEPSSLEFLRLSILAAIKEYYNVWMSEPRYDPATDWPVPVPAWRDWCASRDRGFPLRTYLDPLRRKTRPHI